MRIKVLYLIGSLPIAGSITHLYRLLRGLDKTRIQPVVCCLKREGEYVRRIEELGIPVLGADFPNYRNLKFPKEFLHLIKIVRRERPDIVHTYLFDSSTIGLAAAKLAGVPIAITTRRGDNNAEVRRRIYAYRWTNFLTDRIIAVSKAARESSIDTEKVAPDKIITIHNGIDPDVIDLSISRQEARRSFGVPERAFVVGTMGWFKPVKGFIHVIRSIPAVVSKYPHTRFILAGDGPLKGQLQEELRTLGVEKHVIFPGLLGDVSRLLAAIDILVVPSLSEGISNAILEAMLASKPVVATAVDGNPEVVLNGEAGFLVPPADPSALAVQMNHCIENPQLVEQLGANARQRVLTHFSNERMIESVEALYETLLEEKRPRKDQTYENSYSHLKGSRPPVHHQCFDRGS